MLFYIKHVSMSNEIIMVKKKIKITMVNIYKYIIEYLA